MSTWMTCEGGFDGVAERISASVVTDLYPVKVVSSCS